MLLTMFFCTVYTVFISNTLCIFLYKYLFFSQCMGTCTQWRRVAGCGGRGVFSSVGIRRKINGPNPTFNIIEQKERQSDRQIEREGGGWKIGILLWQKGRTSGKNNELFAEGVGGADGHRESLLGFLYHGFFQGSVSREKSKILRFDTVLCFERFFLQRNKVVQYLTRCRER